MTVIVSLRFSTDIFVHLTEQQKKQPIKIKLKCKIATKKRQASYHCQSLKTWDLSLRQRRWHTQRMNVRDNAAFQVMFTSWCYMHGNNFA